METRFFKIKSKINSNKYILKNRAEPYPTNPFSIPSRRQLQNSYITRTEHIHPSVFMLCSCYVHDMFMR